MQDLDDWVECIIKWRGDKQFTPSRKLNEYDTL